MNVRTDEHTNGRTNVPDNYNDQRHRPAASIWFKNNESFSFLAITFDIIKILTSSFYWWATLFMPNPGIANMAIFEFNDMVSIYIKSELVTVRFRHKLFLREEIKKKLWEEIKRHF